VISLNGSCKEDHANEAGAYVGKVVRWRNDKTKKISTYGSVSINNIMKWAYKDALRPTVYQPPATVTFENIEIDVSRNQWTIHGVSTARSDSDDVDLGSGYATTCHLVVVKRSTRQSDI
jgi:hypothetical protein